MGRRASKIGKGWVVIGLMVCVLVGLVVSINLWMSWAFGPISFSDAGRVPANDVGLVLGTGPLTDAGQTNLHFIARIQAAEALYYAGKVRHLLLSGDNRSPDYDEPAEMRNALLKRGIPESAMTLDRAGLRTLDSVVRAKEIFGQQKLTIVTQPFHAARAAFLAKQSGVDAVVFCADKLPWQWELRANVRETIARVKAVLDVYVLHVQPKHLGEKVAIRLNS